MFKKHTARVRLQGVPRLRARRRADRRDARREARTPEPATADAPTKASAAAKLDLGQENAPPRISPPPIETMKVVAHDDGWALKVDDIDEPAFVVSTKKSAVDSAKDHAEHFGATLLVHTKSGKLQKTYEFGDADAS